MGERYCQFLDQVFPFMAPLIDRSSEYDMKVFMKRVHISYSEIDADVTRYIGQWAWVVEDPGRLN